MSLIPDELPFVPHRRPTSPNDVERDAGTSRELEIENTTVEDDSNTDTIHVSDVSSSSIEPQDVAPVNELDADDIMVIQGTTPNDMEQRMTLRQLRDMCSEMNLPTTGKKAELASRIFQERERSNDDSKISQPF